jgi:protein translocase SecG subunit
MFSLDIILIVLAVALIAAILMQTRSAGIGGAFGGGAEGFHVRRGSEKVLFRTTVVLSVLFLLVVAAHLFIQ